MWKGKQKAVLASLLSFFTTLAGQIISGDPIDVDAQINVIAQIAGELAISAISAALMYAVVYLKANVIGDGTEQRFVTESGQVKDAGGNVIDTIQAAPPARL